MCGVHLMLSDIQAMLLTFFGQELVAHAASMFAALGGAFYFISNFRPKPYKIRRVLVFSVVSALLISIVIYTGFRMVVYGQLSALVVGSEPSPQVPPEQPKLPNQSSTGNWTLATYYYYIVNLSRSSLNERTWWNKWFFELSGSFYYPTNEPNAAYTVVGVGLISFCSVFFSTVSLSRVFYLVKHTPSYVAELLEKARRILTDAKRAEDRGAITELS